MKIAILENIGAFGILLLDKSTDGKAFVRDKIDIDVGREGTLIVGERSYSTEDGHISIPEYLIAQGPNKLIFCDKTGNYNCGKVHRNGRFITAESIVEPITVQLALAYERQGEEIKQLRAELSELREKYGINIMGG